MYIANFLTFSTKLSTLGPVVGISEGFVLHQMSHRSVNKRKKVLTYVSK